MGRQRARHLGKRNIERDLALLTPGTSIATSGITPVRNARTFGAVGDGVTSDATAITSTDTAAVGSHFAYLPPGTYLVDSDLSLTADWFISPGAQFSIAKFSIRSAAYKWTVSSSGTSEYYLELAAGGDPGITLSTTIYENGSLMRLERAGNLGTGEHTIDDNDTLGFFTVYVRLADSADPDSKAVGFVEAGNVITFDGYVTAGAYQIASGSGIMQFADSTTPEIYPEWYGAVGDAEFGTNNGTDDSSAWSKVLKSVSDFSSNPDNITGGVIKLTRRYRVGHLVGPTKCRFTLLGSGRAKSGLLLKSSTEDFMLTIHSGYVHMENFRMDGNKSGNTSGGCLEIIDSAGYVSAQNMNFVRGAEYCMWSGNSGQGVFIECTFLFGDHTGARVANYREINFYTCTFEDNDAIGCLVEGTSFNMLVNFYGCYFEQNGGDPDATGPIHLKIDGWTNEEHSASVGNSAITVQGCYFYGFGATSTHIGVWIDGSDLHGIHINKNVFRDCGGNAFVIDSPPATLTNIGMNTLLHNQFTGTTPAALAIDTASGGFEPWGFIVSDHTAQTIVTPIIDLTVTNTIKLYAFDAFAWTRIKEMTIFWQVGASAAVTINIGRAAAGTHFTAFTTSGSDAINTVIPMTFSGATGLKTTGDDFIRFNNTGTANAGSIILRIDFYDWTQMDK